ncbi:MAG TPA: hypothetical protein VIM73_07460, partial [Polyangiaceae bacterium]
ARQGVPRSVESFLDVTRRLARLQRELGFNADASVTVEYANDTLRRLGMPELSEQDVLSDEREAASGPMASGRPLRAASGERQNR